MFISFLFLFVLFHPMSDSIYWFCVVSFSFPIVNRGAIATRKKRRTIINGLFSSPIVYVAHTYLTSLFLSLSRCLLFVLYKRKPCKSWSRPYFKQIWNSISTQPLKSKCRSQFSHRIHNNGKHRHWRILFGQISIDSTRWSANYSDVRRHLIRRKKSKSKRQDQMIKISLYVWSSFMIKHTLSKCIQRFLSLSYF